MYNVVALPDTFQRQNKSNISKPDDSCHSILPYACT